MKLEEFGGNILNIDLVVIAEEPNINSYKNAIKKELSELLKIDESNTDLIENFDSPVVKPQTTIMKEHIKSKLCYHILL